MVLAQKGNESKTQKQTLVATELSFSKGIKASIGGRGRGGMQITGWKANG